MLAGRNMSSTEMPLAGTVPTNRFAKMTTLPPPSVPVHTATLPPPNAHHAEHVSGSPQHPSSNSSQKAQSNCSGN